MRRLLLLGLNHTTAPLDLREKLAFSQDQTRSALARVRSAFPESEFLLLSTCNRVELYTARAPHGGPRLEDLTAFLADFHSVPAPSLTPHIYHKSEHDVVAHLFAVASSLDSMVLGETQILGQVRSAYDLAHELSATGPILN